MLDVIKESTLRGVTGLVVTLFGFVMCATCANSAEALRLEARDALAYDLLLSKHWIIIENDPDSSDEVRRYRLFGGVFDHEKGSVTGELINLFTYVCGKQAIYFEGSIPSDRAMSALVGLKNGERLKAEVQDTHGNRIESCTGQSGGIDGNFYLGLDTKCPPYLLTELESATLAISSRVGNSYLRTISDQKFDDAVVERLSESGFSVGKTFDLKEVVKDCGALFNQ